MHPFDAALELRAVAPGRCRGTTAPGYANMVGPFGGLTNALMLEAVLRQPERRGEPIALTVNFAGPVADGEFEIVTEATRTNRTTQHWSMRLQQGDEVTTTATAVFAERRATWSAREAVMPDVPRPDALPRAATTGLPVWVDRYDLRFVDGGLPAFDGAEQGDSRSRLWVRDEPPRPLSFASLASLCDVFFPRVFVRRRRFAPAGTVSITTYFHADAAQLAAQAGRHLLGVARAARFHDGYFDQSAELWGDAGDLLASSHQVVYFRD